MANEKFSDDINQLDDFRQQHTGRLFLYAHRDFSERAIVKLRRLGHSSLSLAHTNLLANLDLDGTRLTTLAERSRVTKQAIGQLVLELEKAGYIGRTIDPTDRRATIVTFTVAGWQFLQDANQVKHEIEEEYRAILGEADLQTLRDLLTKLLEAK